MKIIYLLFYRWINTDSIKWIKEISFKNEQLMQQNSLRQFTRGVNFGRSSGWGGDSTDSSGGEGWVARIHPPRTRTWIKVLISLNHCSPSSAFHQTVRYLWPLPFLPPSFFPRSPRSYHRPTLANRQKSICTYPMILKTRGLFFFSFFPFFFSSSPLNLYNHNTASRNRGDLNFDGTTMSLTSPPKLLLNLILQLQTGSKNFEF